MGDRERVGSSGLAGSWKAPASSAQTSQAPRFLAISPPPPPSVLPPASPFPARSLPQETQDQRLWTRRKRGPGLAEAGRGETWRRCTLARLGCGHIRSPPARSWRPPSLVLGPDCQPRPGTRQRPQALHCRIWLYRIKGAGSRRRQRPAYPPLRASGPPTAAADRGGDVGWTLGASPRSERLPDPRYDVTGVCCLRVVMDER